MQKVCQVDFRGYQVRLDRAEIGAPTGVE